MGTSRLIQQGAHPLITAQDVLDDLDLTHVTEQQAIRRLVSADEVETRLLEVLGEEPLHLDEIRSRSGLPIERVSATLVIMELKGMVRPVGGMNYVAIREEQADYH